MTSISFPAYYSLWTKRELALRISLLEQRRSRKEMIERVIELELKDEKEIKNRKNQKAIKEEMTKVMQSLKVEHTLSKEEFTLKERDEALEKRKKMLEEWFQHRVDEEDEECNEKDYVEMMEALKEIIQRAEGEATVITFEYD
jgi:vacuolar-type H+-ATPase subunit E/Vma4